MSINRFLRHSTSGWCAILLVTGIIMLAFYGETKVFTPVGFGIRPMTAPPYKTLEDGYLAQHQPERLDAAMLTRFGNILGMNVVQMPSSGVAYFESNVPQSVIDEIVAQFDKNAPEPRHAGAAFRFRVNKRIDWLRFSVLLAVAFLGALAIQGLASFDLPRSQVNG